MTTKLFLLCICFLLPMVWSQEDLCETYHENYTCEAAPTASPISLWLPQHHRYMEIKDTPATCGNNTMETTLKLFEEGILRIDKEYAKLNGKDEAILMVGNTGTGKSTLTYFVAGNDSAIISTQTSIGEFRIRDCNDKIGDSLVVSRTTFPEAVVDENGTAFFDYPGFLDTRDLPCVEIANSYFMMDVAQRLKRAKIMMVIEYSVIQGNKGAFFSTLKSVIDFIPSIEELGPGIGLLATKYDKEKTDHSKVVEFIIAFLNIILADPLLDQTFQDPVDLRKAKFLITTFKKSTNIGIFRVPNDCGPLSTIDLMIKNKQDLQNVMLDNVNFVDVKPAYFGYSLSTDIKLEISYMRSNLSLDITESLTTVKDVVSNFFIYNCNDQTQCNQVYQTIAKLYNDDDFTSKYANFDSWSGNSIKLIVENTTAVYFEILGSNLSSEVSKALLTNSEYLDILESLDHVPVNLAGLYLPLKNLQANISSGFKQFGNNLNNKIELTLESACTTFFNKIFPTDVCDQVTCKERITYITNLYGNSDFNANYPTESNSMSYKDTIIRLTNITGFELGEASLSYSRIIDDISILESGFTINVNTWLGHFRGLKAKVDNAVNTHFKASVHNLFTESLTTVKDVVSNFINYDCSDQTQCNQVYQTIAKLYNDDDFTSKYANFDSWSGNSIKLIVENTTAVYFEILGSNLSSEVSKALLTNSEYLDILESLDHVPVNLAGLYLPLKNLQANISSGFKQFGNNLNNKIELTLESACTTFFNKIFPTDVCDQVTCKERMTYITNLYGNSDFNANYPTESNSMSYKDTIIRLTNITGFELGEASLSYSRIIDDISILESGFTINVNTWLGHFRGLKAKVDNAVNTHFKASVHNLFTESLTTVKVVVSNFINYDCSDQTQCNQVYQTIAKLYNDDDFTSKYANFDSWSGNSIKLIVENTTAVYFEILGSNLSSEVSKALLTNSEYLDILESLDHVPVNLAGLYLPLKNLQTNISSSVIQFGNNLNNKIELTLESACSTLYNKIFTSEVCDKVTCKERLTDITKVYSNSDFNSNYLEAWAGMSYQDTIVRLTNITGFELSEALQSYSSTLDEISKLESGITVDVDAWLGHFRGFKTKVDNAVKTHFKNSVYSLIQIATGVVYDTVLATKKFAELDDIFSVKTQITVLTRTTLNYKVAMDSQFLEGNLDAKIFLEKTIANFKDLGLANAESLFNAEFDPSLYFKFFENNNFSIQLDKSEKLSWFESLTNFEVSVSYESVWYKFLVDLFGDLSHQNTQIGNVWKFKDWYSQNGEFNSSTYKTEFVTFWDTFSAVPTIQGQHLTEITMLLNESDDWMSKIDSLNNLLTTTLADTLKCIYSTGILNCTGVIVSLQKVLSYQDLPDDAFANTHTLAIKALHTFFLDHILTGDNFKDNIDVYIISPTWVTSEGSINLDGHAGDNPPPAGGIGGADGSPGGVGSNAGNLYGIVGTSPMTYPTITANGGQGGNGQVGQNGRPGVIGKTNEVSADSGIIWASHCTATSGEVSLSSTICSKSCTCYDADDSTDTGYSSCHAGGKGAWFEVTGDDGTNGYNGGDGGKPGNSGLGGYVYLKNVADSTNRDKVGLEGSQGSEGSGGSGGAGGRNGDLYKVRIDDVGGSRSDTRVNKRCERKESNKTPQLQLQPGSYGVAGASSVGAATPVPHNFNYKNLVPDFIKQFNATAEGYKANKFLKAPLVEFQARVSALLV